TINEQTTRVDLRQALGRLQARKAAFSNATQPFRGGHPDSALAIAYHLYTVPNFREFSSDAFEDKFIRLRESPGINLSFPCALVYPELSVFVFVTGNSAAQLFN